jgi:hypothetical protein
MVAVSELVDRLGVIELLDAWIGPIKTRDRGHTGGQLLVGVAAAQLAGEDFLVGLDRHRDDAAGQILTPVPGLGSTTAAGLAQRLTDGQWHAVETAMGDIHTAMLNNLSCAARKVIAAAQVVCRYSLIKPSRMRVCRGVWVSRSWTVAGCCSALGGSSAGVGPDAVGGCCSAAGGCPGDVGCGPRWGSTCGRVVRGAGFW